MPDNIIAQWLNLPNVEISKAVTRNGSTEIYLHRDESLDYICSNCNQRSFWSWDSRLVRIRDLSVFAYKAYLNIYKYRTNCPECDVKIEKLDFVDSYSRCTSRFEALVARLCRITNLKQVAELLELDWKTVKLIFGNSRFCSLKKDLIKNKNKMIKFD